MITMNKEHEERFRILFQHPYTFVYVDTYWKMRDKGCLPIGITEEMDDNCSIWQLTVPVRKSSENWYLERWFLCGVHKVEYLDFCYSEEEKHLLNEGLLKIKREEHFRKHIHFGCQITLHSLDLPPKVYKAIRKKVMNGESIRFDCDGGMNDRHPFKFEES